MKKYEGSSHVFTSRTDDELIGIKAGPNERLDFTGNVAPLYDDTDSTNVSTGSLVLAGGLGLAKSMYVGGSLTFLGTHGSSNGGGSIGTGLFVEGPATIGNQSTVAGALILTGGIGVGKNLYATNLSAKSLDVFGTGTSVVTSGLQVGGSLSATHYAGGSLTVHQSGTNIGGLGVTGGFTGSSAIIVGNNARFTNVTNATSVSSGSLYTSGGCGVALDVRVGGTLYTNGLVFAGAGGEGLGNTLYSGIYATFFEANLVSTTGERDIHINAGTSMGYLAPTHATRGILINETARHLVDVNFEGKVSSGVAQNIVMRMYVNRGGSRGLIVAQAVYMPAGPDLRNNNLSWIYNFEAGDHIEFTADPAMALLGTYLNATLTCCKWTKIGT